SDIAALDSVRDQKSVSLNLKVRKEERARLDKERLERENARRAAKNQPAFKSVEELGKTKETADAGADQATQEMADVVTAPRPAPGAEDRAYRRTERGQGQGQEPLAQEDPEQVPDIVAEHVRQPGRGAADGGCREHVPFGERE